MRMMIMMDDNYDDGDCNIDDIGGNDAQSGDVVVYV